MNTVYHECSDKYSRAIVIGDVHGCPDEVDELLRTCDFKKGRDRLIFLGDLVDRGYDSAGAVAKVRELQAECTFSNHEEKMLRFRGAYRKWRTKGSKSSEMPLFLTESQVKIFFSIPDEDWDWLEQRPARIEITPHLWAVHAGFEPGTKWEDQEKAKMIRIRYVDHKGKWDLDDPYWTTPTGGGYFWSEGWRGPQSVIYGHSTWSEPRLDVHRDDTTGEVISWCLGIDTGCVYGDSLSSVIVDLTDATKPSEVVQVKARSTYYKEPVVVESKGKKTNKNNHKQRRFDY